MKQNAFAAWLIWPDGAPPSSIDLYHVQPGAPDAALGMIVLYVDPKNALAWAVQNHGEPGKAISDWTDTARLVLRLHRQDRRRIRLVQRPLTSLDEIARKQQLLEHFDGNALPSLTPQHAAQDESVLSWATLALLASDERRLLVDELVAATTGSTAALDADAALRWFGGQLDTVRQCELLLSQIDDLERQLHKVSNVRERLWREIKDLKSRLKAETSARKAIYASTSWRVTAPMRGVARILKGRRPRRPLAGTRRKQN